MKRCITGLSAVACLLLPVAASALDTLAAIRDRQGIVIAYREGSAPFSYLDENKRPVGYSVDLCVKIAEAVKRELKLPNLKLQFMPVDSVTRFSAIVEGKADLECGTTTNNAERRKKVAFTIPHFFSSVRALVRTDAGIRNWPDLRSRTVVTTRSTTTVHLLNERNNVRSLNIKLIEGADDGDSFRLVEAGKADVFPMDDVLLYSLRAAAKKPDMFAIVGDPLSVEPYAIMLRKDDALFKKLVDAEMVRIVNDGEIYRLYDKWFTRPIPPNGINLNMPMGYLLRDSLRFPTDKVGEQ
ncbi:MAG TPA: amino acid ABC transporter substrate-binding protein [Noviherbaspirillum sp.]|nr:amino acid ABC transporter substrate-binding protein [Noviherbaspirillum sp.]